MRILYFSLLLCFAVLTSSCKQENQITRVDLEELQKREQDSVKELLTLSRDFAENGRYDDAIVNLNIIINNFGTYEEYIEALKLKDELHVKVLVRKIEDLNDIQEIQKIAANESDPRIKETASLVIEDIINTTKDPQQLQDYLSGEGFKEHQKLASNRLANLREQLKDEAYANAVDRQNSDVWKAYLEAYPNDPRKDKIAELIIKLEVDEIFDGEYGDIPQSQLSGVRNENVSEINIKNDTRYTLTLRYSGRDIRKIIISPQASKTVTLKSGEYRVTASVDAYNVRNFAGRESLYGEYSSSYYIQ